MKCLLGISMAFLLVLGCTSNSSAPPSDEAVKYVGRERLRDILKDPDSLEIISEEVWRPGKNGGKLGYEATYRAKNSFGGYAVDTFYTE